MLKKKLLLWKEFYGFQKLGIPPVKQEKISKSLLKKILPANPVMIDCGAHDGTDSIELVRVLGGTLHAFEPVPYIFHRLTNNTKPYKQITAYQVALSNQTGKQVFYVSEGRSDASSSLLPPKDHLIDHADTYFKQKIEVDTITLDDWAAKYRIPAIDLLWLDMQGFEMQMLSESKIIFPSVKAIHTEVSTKETYEGVQTYINYKNFLQSSGFKCVIEAIPQGWDMGNALFVKS